MIASALALLLMQVGPNPAQGAFPGIPEELRDRPVRDQARGVRQPVIRVISETASFRLEKSKQKC